MQQIRELMSQLSLYLRLEAAMCDKLNDLENRVYKLEEDNKLLQASKKSLEHRLSELMMIVKTEAADRRRSDRQ